ncbi:unnamed protein product [Cunninghamella blakesleeana]
MNTLPIMPRQSSDGDCPSGLKFTRNNYYGFQKDQISPADRNTGSLFSNLSRHTDNNSSTRPSIDSDRPILPSAKPTFSVNSTAMDRATSQPSITSPTLPTRSPQRVRDSQTSTSQSLYTSDSGYASRYYQSTNSPIPSVNNESYRSDNDYLNISSSSSPPPSRPRLSDARFSLSKEVSKLWKNQDAKIDTANNNHENKMMQDPNELLNQLLISQAVIDSQGFKLLSFDELEKLNQEYNLVKEQVKYSASRLTLELKLKEASKSLTYLNDLKSGHSYIQQQQEFKSIDRKMDELVTQHQQLKAKEYDLHCQLLEHTAGILSKGVRQSDKVDQSIDLTSSINKTHHDNDEQQLSSTTHQTLLVQLREYENDIKKKENEIQYLKANNNNSNNNNSNNNSIPTTSANENYNSILLSKDKEIEQLKSNHQDTQTVLDHALQQLITMTKHYSMNDSNKNNDKQENEKSNGDDVLSMLTQLENVLSTQKTHTGQLQIEIDSILEKQRLEAMAEKKYEIQLRATQERRDAAEARCQELMNEMNQLKALKKSSMSELDKLKADVDNFSFNDSSVHLTQIANLESQLHQSKEQCQNLEKELSILHNKVSDLEVEHSKQQAELTSSKQHEVANKLELQHYRDENYALQTEKKKWERMMKRQTVMQLMDEGSVSIKDKYEQQLEEQEQEYIAQLKEQKIFLDKVIREKEASITERNQFEATCKDLEELIRGKTKLLDTRDVRINELEAELKELKLQSSSGHRSNHQGTVDASVLRELQDAFTQKEIAWMEQSANMEANFEGILKEFDRLTGTAVEFENDRMTYERKMDGLNRHISTLENELAELRVNRLGYEDGKNDTPTTASLRKEFRRMVNDMKLEHQRLVDREVSETKRVEKQLKDLKHELAMSSYEKVNKGVQTLFIK